MSKKNSRTRSEFGQSLRDLRKKRKLTMKRLADLLDVSESYISRLESGERHPDKDLILQLGPILLPEGNVGELDKLLIAADYTPVNLEKKTGRDDLIGHFQEVLEREPENFRAFNALVISLIKQNNYDLARQHIQAGLETYQASIHLKILMGNLELVQGNFEQALLLQQEALQIIEQSPEEASRLFLKRNDSLLNLAVIYFLMGYQATDAYLQSPTAERYQHARLYLVKASEALKEALEIDPNDIYVLDEYARVEFNLAYLDSSAGADACYEASISAFQRVIHSEDKALLNYSDLIESSLFLVHAYAKQKDFVAAEQAIHIIEACLPNFWLAQYIKACVYSLKYMATTDQQCLDVGFRAFERALSIPDKNNRTRSEAAYDPDLQALKIQDPKRFNQVLKSEAKS